jgi:hypothetical protein
VLKHFLYINTLQTLNILQKKAWHSPSNGARIPIQFQTIQKGTDVYDLLAL